MNDRAFSCPLSDLKTVIITDSYNDHKIVNLTPEQIRLLKWMKELLNQNDIAFIICGEDKIETV